MNEQLLPKLKELIAALTSEGKEQAANAGLKAIQQFTSGDKASALKTLVEACKLDKRFSEFLGADGATADKIAGIAKAAGGILDAFKA